MNPAKKALVRTHKFVTDHKIAIAVVTTATATTAVVGHAAKIMNNDFVEAVSEFLGEKNLLEEFNDRFMVTKI